jgi:carboxyl-terminal processing protease
VRLQNHMNRLVKSLVVTASLGLVCALLLGTVLADNKDPQDVYRHFAVYTEVLTRIKSEYVEKPDMQDVTLGALNGLLESIDPYASYLNEEQFRQYEKDSKGKKADVGLILSRKVGYVSVVDAIPGSPAAEAGVTTGDMIETIDGVATRDMPLAYAEMLLGGRPGSEVELSVLRVRQGAEPQALKLERAARMYPPVRIQMLPGKIGHIRVESLETGKTASIAKNLKKLTDQGAEKIILDLRRAAYGDPREGLALADLFVDDGLMAYLEGQKVLRQDFSATPQATVSKLPMVTVINRGTAQGAEVAASALLEDKRCEVVGERSYGDAAMRKAVKLQDGGAVILSVAKYHTGAGKAIQDEGVTPSVVSIAREAQPEPGSEPTGIIPRPELSVDDDTILQKAIEVLTEGVPEEVAANPVGGGTRGESLSPLGTPLPPDSNP